MTARTFRMDRSNFCAVVRAPELAPIRLSLEDSGISSILSAIEKDPDLCFFINYDLETKSGELLSQIDDITKHIENNEINLKLKVLEYGERELLRDAQNLLRIVFTLSSKFHHSDVSQSVSGWLSRNFAEKLPTEKDLSLPVPETFMDGRWGSSLKFVDLARCDVTMNERLNGVILKLQVKTNENTTATVYGAPDGWYVKGGKHFPCLCHLLKTVSKGFADNYYLMAKKWCELDRLEQIKYSSVEDNHCFKPGKTKKGTSNAYSAARILDEESGLAVPLQLDDEIDSLEDDEVKPILARALEQKFVQQGLEAINMIKRGLVIAVSETGSKFMVNDLFITKVDDTAEFFATRGGRVSFEKSVRNEIRLFHALHHAKEGFRVLRTMMIDYFNERWVVQSLVPGLRNGHAKSVHGLSVCEKDKFSVDPEFKEFFENTADAFGIAPSEVKSCSAPILSSGEVQGVVGTDGVKYLIEMNRLTPRDANYPDPVKHHSFIVRDEAIVSFARNSALEAHGKELIALGGKKELEYLSDAEDLSPEAWEKLLARRDEILQTAARPKFDINALTIDSKAKGTPKNISDLAKYLVDVLVPRVCKSLLDMSLTDGKGIVAQLHNAGLNVRYLGRVTQTISKDQSTPLARALKLILESEMITRSFKTLIRIIPDLKLPDFFAKLNILVGLSGNETERKQFFEEVKAKCQEKFGYAPALPVEGQKVLIIRSVLQAFGISVACSSFESPLKAEDVVTIRPVIAFPFTERVSLVDSIVGEASNEERRERLMALVEESRNPSCNLEDVVSAYFYLALLDNKSGNAEQARKEALRYLIARELSEDVLNPGFIFVHGIMASMLEKDSNVSLPFAFQARAAHMARVLLPFHPFVAESFLAAAQIILTTNEHVGMACLEQALASAQKIEMDKEFVAKIYHHMSICQIKANHLKEAIEYEQLAYDQHPSDEYKRSVELLKTEFAKA